jgi:hypothetical protein
MINAEFIELTKLVGLLFSVVAGFVLTGIANNCLVKDEPFEGKRLVKGLVKAFTACAGLIVVSYVCTIIDLSGLGFEPKTAITSGILVYSAKLIRNAFGLLGLSKNGKEEKDSEDEPLLRKEVDTNNINEGESLNIEEADFEDIDLYKDSQKEASDIESDPKAVG